MPRTMSAGEQLRRIDQREGNGEGEGEGRSAKRAEKGGAARKRRRTVDVAESRSLGFLGMMKSSRPIDGNVALVAREAGGSLCESGRVARYGVTEGDRETERGGREDWAS